MATISAFHVTQHSQIFSLFFRNRIQCIALYQLHNSQALLNLRLTLDTKFTLLTLVSSLWKAAKLINYESQRKMFSF